MVAHLLQLAALVSLLVTVVMWLCQRRALRTAPRRATQGAPAISILKPLKGLDPDLESNLESFFGLDYPAFELVFGVQAPSDPALALARRLAERHPDVPCRFVASDRAVGHNPKVNNLANMLPAARHEVLLISDSNVRVDPGYLWAMTAELEFPGVALVTSLIRGVEGAGLGGRLERLQLNTFVMSGVAAVAILTRRACAVGKSMMLRRTDLERLGGFAELGRYLAEDQVCGDSLTALGARVAVSASPVDNVLGRLRLADFAARHLRWARIRRHIDPLAYAAEVFANPVAWAAAAAAVEPGAATAAFAGALLTIASGLAWDAERRLGIAGSAFHYPALELVRALTVALLWPVPFLSSRVSWRGATFRIGRRTLLEPLEQPGPVWPGASSPELAAEKSVA